MNITLFGGTGITGLLLLEKALQDGHKVTAFARAPTKIAFQHPNLVVVQGELTQVNKVEEAIRGADAVISLLGPTGISKTLDIANGIRTIISVMQKQGVSRLVATGSSSYRDPRDKFQFWLDAGVVLLKALASSIYRDIIKTGEHITNSSLDWTLVRLPKLSSGAPTGKLHVGYTGDGNISFFSLTRKDLVNFLIRQIADSSNLRQTPVISN